MMVEIIVTSLAEAITAKKLGADRLELIDSFDYGGLSPKLELTKTVCKQVDIPVNIMLRSNPCMNFNYNSRHVTIMLNELEYIRDYTNANGIVFGALDNNRNIDVTLLKLIIAHKGHLKLTFHRAIDMSNNVIENYQRLLDYKEVEWVLTSGGMATALEGAVNIRQMVELSIKRQYAKILAGSGITPNNANELIKKTGVSEIHIGTGVRINNILSAEKIYNTLESLQTSI
ncbi:MAG: hypothetical protein K2P99_00145 [Burkholderiales bacterium]|nr:hypothetical protein [Burkholderiales bacterium]